MSRSKQNGKAERVERPERTSEVIARRALETPEIPFGLRKTIASMDGTFDPDVADAVLERVADGLTLKAACVQLEVPARWVREWILRDAGADLMHNPLRLGMRELYRQARLMQAETWADEIVEIADETRAFEEQRAKLRIDTRKWLMGKTDERYVETQRTVLEGGANPVRVLHGLEDIQRELRERGLPTSLLIDEDDAR